MNPSGSTRRIVLLVHLTLAALALGAPVFFATAVAPAVLRAAPGRDVAADLIGQILSSLSDLLQVSFAGLFGTTLFLTRPIRKSRLAIVCRRLPVLAFVSALVVRSLGVPAMDTLRRRYPNWAQLSAGSPVRLRFSRLHSLSVSLLVLELLCAFALLVLAVRLPAEGDGRER